MNLEFKREFPKDNPFVKAFPNVIDAVRAMDNSDLTADEMREISNLLHLRHAEASGKTEREA